MVVREVKNVCAYVCFCIPMHSNVFAYIALHSVLSTLALYAHEYVYVCMYVCMITCAVAHSDVLLLLAVSMLVHARTCIHTHVRVRGQANAAGGTINTQA